jgi:hypothetical protein
MSEKWRIVAGVIALAVVIFIVANWVRRDDKLNRQEKMLNKVALLSLDALCDRTNHSLVWQERQKGESVPALRSAANIWQTNFGSRWNGRLNDGDLFLW